MKRTLFALSLSVMLFGCGESSEIIVGSLENELSTPQAPSTKECDPKCDSGERCVKGTCVATCEGDLIRCDGECTDLTKLHLDACNECAAGYCDADNDFSNGCEISVKSDANNCGSCGHVCDANEVCTNGKCVENDLKCEGDQTPCHGKCIDLALAHLASCDQCVDNYCDADNDLSNGCEIDFLNDDAANCGACGHACNGDESCQNGVCTSICAENETYCNGTCIDLNAKHMASCEQCASGFADCDAALDNGCEISTNDDAANCGACGRTCNAGESCKSGVCSSICAENETFCGGSCIDLNAKHMASCDQCAAGYENCDGNLENGCEVSMQGDAKNCGACGNKCGIGKTCDGGACKSSYNDHDRLVVGVPDGDTLRVRADSNGGSAELGGLLPYQYFRALGERDGWLLIDYNGKEGWVYKGYTMSACRECPSRKAIDEAEKYLFSKTRMCTHQLYLNGLMNNLGYGGGWDNNCANFVTAALMNVGLFSYHFDEVREIRDYCFGNGDGYHQVAFEQGRAGDIWFVKDHRSHTELVVGVYVNPENNQTTMVTIGSTNFNACDTNSGRGGDVQLVTYTERLPSGEYVFTKQ